MKVYDVQFSLGVIYCHRLHAWHTERDCDDLAIMEGTKALYKLKVDADAIQQARDLAQKFEPKDMQPGHTRSFLYGYWYECHVLRIPPMMAKEWLFRRAQHSFYVFEHARYDELRTEWEKIKYEPLEFVHLIGLAVETYDDVRWKLNTGKEMDEILTLTFEQSIPDVELRAFLTDDVTYISGYDITGAGGFCSRRKEDYQPNSFRTERPRMPIDRLEFLQGFCYSQWLSGCYEKDMTPGLKRFWQFTDDEITEAYEQTGIISERRFWILGFFDGASASAYAKDYRHFRSVMWKSAEYLTEKLDFDEEYIARCLDEYECMEKIPPADDKKK